jgi:hypothetical protein
VISGLGSVTGSDGIALVKRLHRTTVVHVLGNEIVFADVPDEIRR